MDERKDILTYKLCSTLNVLKVLLKEILKKNTKYFSQSKSKRVSETCGTSVFTVL